MEGVKPKVRGSGLLVQQLGDELLVYDLEQNVAHCLNGIAAAVWALCDGERTVAEIGPLLGSDLAPADVEALVWCALDQFAERGLLEEIAAEEPDRAASALMTRRQVARLGLVVGLALPLVESIVSPPAAMAQSGTTGNTGMTGQAAAANSLAEALRGLWRRFME